MVDAWDGDEIDKLARDLFELPLWIRASLDEGRRYKPATFAPPDDTSNHYSVNLSVAFHGGA